MQWFETLMLEGISLEGLILMAGYIIFLLVLIAKEELYGRRSNKREDKKALSR